ncbi:mannose-6-phosphate isomerase, partial [Alphaproteobacteria bacterium]|nr:mannose-6-phosphate isomerase [Alphaproteobacteria bacterium]
MTKSIKKPWGSYVILSKSKDYLIKKIIVKPEGVLSYQSHNFRSEHW